MEEYEYSFFDSPLVLVLLVIQIASIIHVFWDSKHDAKIGHPWMHAIMCAIIIWPIPYLCWLFWWPGKLRQKLFGSDEKRAQLWANEIQKNQNK